MVYCNNNDCKNCKGGTCALPFVSIIDDSCVSYRRRIYTDWRKLVNYNKAVVLGRLVS